MIGALVSYAVPTAWKWAALAALLVAAAAFGWTQGVSHEQKARSNEKAAQAVVIVRQATKVAAITEAQSNVTQETDRNVQDRIDAVHRYYSSRLREQPSAVRPGTMPAASVAAGDPSATIADAGPVAGGLRAESWGQLAERCAVTTVVAQGWQDWWAGIERAQGVAP